MSVITFYPNIPNAPDNPSFDQPLMKINAQADNSIWAVDHVTFNVANPGGTTQLPGQGSGQHAKVTFNSNNPPGGGNPIDPVSVMYTNSAAGQASAISEVYYINNNATLPISAIKAFGYCSPSPSVLNSFNLATVNPVVRLGVGSFQINLVANVLTGNNYSIFATTYISGLGRGGDVVAQINSATQFQLAFYSLNTQALADPSFFSFMVMQF